MGREPGCLGAGGHFRCAFVVRLIDAAEDWLRQWEGLDAARESVNLVNHLMATVDPAEARRFAGFVTATRAAEKHRAREAKRRAAQKAP